MLVKIAKNTFRPLYYLLQKVLEKIENGLLMFNYKPSFSPIFIIGVPRSGSTLLYQLIAYCFEVSYLTNKLAKHNTFPCILSLPLSIIGGCNSPELFDSNYGEVPGWRSPSQGWTFWDRWFPSEDQSYVGLNELSEATTKKLRNTILLMEKIYKRPFVNKAMSLGVRILPVSHAFPEALFIRIHRNQLDIAQSILKGRSDYMGDKNKWFSVKPSEYEKIKDKDYITQVCGQIYFLERDMDRDIQIIGKHRCLDIQYAELCTNPKSVIEKIEQFYNLNTYYGQIRKRKEPPPYFNLSTGKKCNDSDYNLLKKSLQHFYGKSVDI